MTFKKRMKTINVPAGFTSEFIEKSSPSERTTSFVLKSGDVTISFVDSGAGHTNFKLADGSWRSFDRPGIEDSFYHDHSVDLNKLVAEQFKRIANKVALMTLLGCKSI